jgi:chorismate-pyruvate lyase
MARDRSPVRAALHDRFEQFPRAYSAYVRARHPDRQVVGPTTDLVIEGFPGSANTYVREAFLLVDPSLRIVSHTHSPANALEGARLGVPTLVLVREPLRAVVSLVARHEGHTAAAALRRYIAFYSALRGRLAGVHVATFEKATTALGDITDAMNVRFDTALARFPHEDPELRRRLGEKIRSDDARSVPSEERAVRVADAVAVLREAEPRLTRTAERTYEMFLASTAATGWA